MIDQPFSPAYGQTQTVAVSTTATLIGVDANAKQIRILNTLAAPVFVRVSSSANNTPATAKDYPIAAGMAEVISKADTWGAVSILASTGSGTVYVTPGEGYSSGAK
jgi:hypothetical protein